MHQGAGFLSLFLSISLPRCLYVSLPLCLSVPLSLYVSLFLYLSVSLFSVCVYLRVFVFGFVCPSVCRQFSLPVRLSCVFARLSCHPACAAVWMRLYM